VARLVHRLQERELGCRGRRFRLPAENSERENDKKCYENSPGHECGGCKQTFRTENCLKLMCSQFSNS